MTFDPFENRACRDVRNELGHDFISAIRQCDPAMFEEKAAKKLSVNSKPHIRSFIQQRMDKFKSVWEQVQALEKRTEYLYLTFRILWNHGLFFECHEWVEDAWTQSSGDEKDLLQGLILAAVAYEQYIYRRMTIAASLGEKAAKKLSSKKDLMPPSTDIQVIINALYPLSNPPQI